MEPSAVLMTALSTVLVSSEVKSPEFAQEVKSYFLDPGCGEASRCKYSLMGVAQEDEMFIILCVRFPDNVQLMSDKGPGLLSHPG